MSKALRRSWPQVAPEVTPEKEPPLSVTDKLLKQLRPSERMQLRDVSVTGLRVRISPGEPPLVRWSLLYRKHGELHRHTLGAFPNVSSARKAAARVRAGIDHLGQDPVCERKAERAKAQAERAKGTVAEAWDRFDQRYLAKEVRPATRGPWRGAMRNAVLPKLGRRLPATLTRDDVRPFREHKTSWEVLRLLLSWCVNEGLMDANPCLALKVFGGRKKRRRGVGRAKLLGLAQLGAALPHLPAHVELVAYTAVREHEARSCRWRDLDLDDAVWRVPGEFTKTGEQHMVPLIPAAVRLLQARERSDSTWVFPGAAGAEPCEVCEEKGHAPKTSSKMTARAKEVAGISGRGVIHRIRDTVKTWMTEHGVPSAISERVLGHKIAGIEGVYDHATLLGAQREALTWWAFELWYARAPGETILAFVAWWRRELERAHAAERALPSGAQS
jgi:integrase